MLRLTGDMMLHVIKRLLMFLVFLAVSGCVSEDEEDFFRAAVDGNMEKLEKLMPIVGNPNFLSRKGYTPLGAAAVNGRLDIAKFLVANGADVNYRNQDKDSPLITAIIYDNMDVMIYLLEQGATLSEEEKKYLILHERLGRNQVIIPILKDFGIEIKSQENQ